MGFQDDFRKALQARVDVINSALAEFNDEISACNGSSEVKSENGQLVIRIIGLPEELKQRVDNRINEKLKHAGFL